MGERSFKCNSYGGEVDRSITVLAEPIEPTARFPAESLAGCPIPEPVNENGDE
jgi:hypothetical protein